VAAAVSKHRPDPVPKLTDKVLRTSVERIVDALPRADEMGTRARGSFIELGIALHRHLPAKRVQALLLSAWVDCAEQWGGEV
jgi:hypothetical protein